MRCGRFESKSLPIPRQIDGDVQKTDLGTPRLFVRGRLPDLAAKDGVKAREPLSQVSAPCLSMSDA